MTNRLFGDSSHSGHNGLIVASLLYNLTKLDSNGLSHLESIVFVF